AGRETGGVMGRRFRPFFYYCVNDCLYEIETGLDLDGFGTGNAKNSTNTGTSSILQRGVLWVHLEKCNPWLPTFYTGMDGPAAMSNFVKDRAARGLSWNTTCSPAIPASTPAGGATALDLTGKTRI